MSNNKTTITRLTAIFLFCLATTLWWNLPAHAQEPGQPPDRPGQSERPTMPDRPDKPLPPPQSEPTQPGTVYTGSTDRGAWIELNIMPAVETYWTEIEWIDGTGMWHPVEGWQGHSTQGMVRWFMRPAEFGKGPFHWQIYTQDRNRLIATSNTFYLPTEQFGVTLVSGNKSGEKGEVEERQIFYQPEFKIEK